jgi:tRNA (cmo5U34)-methyltransferase
MNKDEKYRQALRNIEDFTFDSSVSEVFDDMIDRSVPGYRTLLANIGPIAATFIKDNTNCYDLGCSHGAGSLTIFKSLRAKNVNIFAIDNAAAMINQCERMIQNENAASIIKAQQANIQDTNINNASFVLLNLTLQFIPIDYRDNILQKIFLGLNTGGACLITEKIIMEDAATDKLFKQLHENFKSANQYSQLEISQKRKALENVLLREDLKTHKQRLLNTGFSHVTVWFQCINFVSILGIK